MLERIKYFLPQVYKNDPLAQSVLQGIEKYTDEIKGFIWEKFQQLSVSTASDGVGEWEKELAITPVNTNLGVRKAIVKARLMRPPTMIPERLTAIANQFTYNNSAQVIHKKRTYILEVRVPLDDIISSREMYNEIFIAKPAHLSIYLAMEIFQPIPISHKAEIVQIVDARHCFWNLGNVERARWDGEFPADGTIRGTGIRPDSKYQERQYHTVAMQMYTDAKQRQRWHNIADGSVVADGSHFANGSKMRGLVEHAVTFSVVKNNIESGAIPI